MRYLPALLLAARLFGQIQEPDFEAASVKLSPPHSPDGYTIGSRGGPGTSDPGRIIYFNYSLANLVRDAYRIERYQLSAPEWLNSTNVDMEVKVPEGATKEQVAVMLRRLLENRFHLSVHRETQQMPVYLLSVVKGGAKLKVSDGTHAGSGGSTPCGGMTFHYAPMTAAAFAEVAGSYVDRPVIDKTGLTGAYDITITALPTYAKPAASDAVPPPSIFQALQDQLGLRLDSDKAPIERIVVDQVDKKPTEN